MSILKQYIDEFLERVKLDKKSERTQISYQNKLEEFDEIMTELKGNYSDVNAITHKDLQKYIDILSKPKDDGGKENKSSSVENKFITVKTFCKYLYNEEILDNDITVVPRSGKFKLPKKEKRTPKALSVNEYQDMLEKTKWNDDGNNVYDNQFNTLRNQVLLSTLLTGGLRRDEILSLTWGNIKEDYIDVIGKGDKQRYVPLHPITKVAIDEWRKQLSTKLESKGEKLKSDDIVFPSNRNSKMTSGAYWQIINKALMTIGRNRWLVDENGNEVLDENGEKVLNPDAIKPHGLRKSSASSMHKQRIPIETVAQILGHEDVKTTMIYVKVDEEDMQEAVNSIPMKNNFYK